MRNEPRKMVLWTRLLDCDLEHELPTFRDMKYKLDIFPSLDPFRVHLYPDDVAGGHPNVIAGVHPFKTNTHPATTPFLLYIGKMNSEIKRWLEDQGKPAAVADIAHECRQRWAAMSEDELQQWHTLFVDLVSEHRGDGTFAFPFPHAADRANANNLRILGESIDRLRAEVDLPPLAFPKLGQCESQTAYAERTQHVNGNSTESDAPRKKAAGCDDQGVDAPVPSLSRDWQGTTPSTAADFRVTYAADFGLDTLGIGKKSLMQRLRGSDGRPADRAGYMASPPIAAVSPISPVCHTDAPADDEEGAEDDDFELPLAGPGLLTEIPLVLEPSEIEGLPMLLMTCLMTGPEGQPGHLADTTDKVLVSHGQMVRCHTLLSTETGKNLLRELLIFVAAWDLREVELYYAFIVKIMEQVLSNGLMPWAYFAFRE